MSVGLVTFLIGALFLIVNMPVGLILMLAGAAVFIVFGLARIISRLGP